MSQSVNHRGNLVERRFSKLPEIKINEKDKILKYQETNQVIDDMDRDVESIVLKRFEFENNKNTRAKNDSEFQRDYQELSNDILNSSKSFKLLAKDLDKNIDDTRSNNLRQLIDQRFKLYEHDFRIEFRHIETKPFNPPARDGATLTTDGKNEFYMFGGRGNQLYDTIWKFTYLQRRWEEVRTLKTLVNPESRFGHTSVQYKNKN